MKFSFIHVAAWQHQSPTPSPTPSPSPKPQRRSYGHFRSLSSLSQSVVSSPPKLTPATESDELPDMAQASESPALGVPQRKRAISYKSLPDDQEFSTNPDPRSRAQSVANPSGDAETPSHHPDLDTEVAALSTKLVNAINHQTTLDDTLTTTRQELDAAQDRIHELEQQVASQQEMLKGDVWIRRKHAEEEKAGILARLAEEKRQRMEISFEKKKIEQELGDLSTALFEEANNMVISAKEKATREQDALQHKNNQLKAQLADTEGLLKSQQEQLMSLKILMEQMTVEHDDRSGTTPSSPGFSKFDSREDDMRDSDTASQTATAITEPCSPTYPTSFTHLLQPVLRTDLSSYDDFVTLVNTSKRAPPSRASSGSYGGGFNAVRGFAGSMSGLSNSSAASIATSGASASTSPKTPSTHASANSADSTVPLTPLPPLKETKFYKRVLAEDVEPTLRLDTAPGLSWLARRSVLSAMTEGTMVVEPVPTSSPFASISKPQFYSCSLCGESRKDEQHLRNHRFRTSEAESAQRYPLCKYCLGRVRSTCDFLGFLRMLKDGHWRAEDADAERAAWEESVRLREQMFWTRIGGGVVPITIGHGSVGDKSPRPSFDGIGIIEEPRTVQTVKAEAPRSQQLETPPASEDGSDEKFDELESETLPAREDEQTENKAALEVDAKAAKEDEADETTTVVEKEPMPANDVGAAKETEIQTEAAHDSAAEAVVEPDAETEAGPVSEAENADADKVGMETVIAPVDEAAAEVNELERTPKQPATTPALDELEHTARHESNPEPARFSVSMPGAFAE